MNKAITLSDGTDDYVESGKTIIARGTPQHTFSFWVKPSTEDHDDTSTHYIMVWGSETAQNKWSAVALSNDGRLAHVYHASAKRTIDQILPAPGAWYHVVVVVKSISATTAANRDVEFYIDGELYTGNYDAFGSQNNSTSYYLDWGSGTHTSVRLGSLHSASEDSSSSLSTIKLYDTALTAQEVEKLYDMGRLGNGLYPLHIDAPVHINGPLYAPGTILNITQSFFDGGFTTTSGNLQNVFTTDWVSMRKNSKVEVDLSVLYRNDGTAWGGMYLVAWFMVDVPVGSVAADTWVAYVTPGYHMTYYQEIPEYGNTSYLPFNIPTDFKIRFLLQMKPYNSGTTLHINRDHHLWFENASFANLRQFIPITTKRYEQGHNTRGSTYYNGHTGGTKFIIKEIAGL